MRTPLRIVVPTRSRLGLVPAVIVAALFVLQLGASASPPLQETGHYDNTMLLPGATRACGFPVFGRFEGDFRSTVFYDNNGNIVREVDTFPTARITVWAPFTGKSYTSASPAAQHIDYTDGASLGSSAIVSLTGLLEKIDGVDLDGGRLVFEAVVDGYDAAGVPHIHFVREISSNGPDLDAFIGAQRCAAVQ